MKSFVSAQCFVFSGICPSTTSLCMCMNVAIWTGVGIFRPLRPGIRVCVSQFALESLIFMANMAYKLIYLHAYIYIYIYI